MANLKEVVLTNILPGETFGSIDTFIIEKGLGELLTPEDGRTVLLELAQEGIIEYAPEASKRFTVLAKTNIGPDRLLRKFCRKNFGLVSPLVNKKVLSAVLKRHGSNYSIDNTEVRDAITTLAEEGLVKIVDRPGAYLKMLGAE